MVRILTVNPRHTWPGWLLVCSLVVGLLLGGAAVGRPDGRLSADELLADTGPLRLPPHRWFGLLVNVKEFYPVVEYADTSNEIRSLAVMPGIFVQVPDRPFRPFLGVGLGLSVNGLPRQTPLALPSLPIEESLVMHVGGGFSYHLGGSVDLVGSARFARFKATDFLERLSPTAGTLRPDGLDFGTYSVEFGIRLTY